MTQEALRQQISRAVKQALSDSGLSAAGAAAKMPGKPGGKLIYRWINAEVTAPLERLDDFAEAIGQRLTLHLGTAKEAAPSMTRRLLAGVMALEKNAGISPEELEEATRSAEVFDQLAAEADALLAGRLTPSPRKPAGPTGGPGGGQGVSSQGSKPRRPK